MVRKIRAFIARGEHPEKPIVTPCSAIAERSAGDELRGNNPVAPLMSGPDEGVSGATGLGKSSETAVQKCGS